MRRSPRPPLAQCEDEESDDEDELIGVTPVLSFIYANRPDKKCHMSDWNIDFSSAYTLIF